MEIKLTNVGFFPKITGAGKTLLKFMMRTFIFLFCAAAFSITPNMVVSQNAKIVVDADKTVSVDEVFDMITKQTEYSFIYPEKLFKDFPKLELKKGTIRATKLLQQILDDADFNVILTQNNTILIKEKTFTPSGAEVQQQQVTGKVTDAANLPIPGVTVLIKGTGKGTATDFDGNYTITVPNPENVLVFSSLGFENQEITVGNQAVINVTLKEAVATLEEVTINAGYYKTSKRLATGNISKVDAKVIEKQPVLNPIATLQGRVSGLEINQASGISGGNFQVRIRGTNSIENGNDPLYIINGVPYTSTPMSFNETSELIYGNSVSISGLGGVSPLNNINPSDIESIEILKDSDATAIFGSRGANGVVLITTKKGKTGKTKVNFNTYTGIGNIATKADLLNTQQYLMMRNEAFANDEATPTEANARDLLVWDQNKYTDWQKELIGGNAEYTDAQISVSGGNENTQFIFGTGYHKETTVFPGDNSNNRISALLNLSNTSLNDKFNTSVTVNYSTSNTDLLGLDLTRKALALPPNAPDLFNVDGSLNWDGWNSSGPLENPVSYLKRRYESKTNALLANATLSYSIIKNLMIKSSFGYSTTEMTAYNLTPLSSLSPSVVESSQNRTDFSNSKFNNWIVEPQINWVPKIGKSKFNVLLGMQFLNQENEGLSQSATGFSNEALMKNITAATNINFGTNYYAQYRYNALFGRINYNYSDRYIFNLTGRRDGSSRFGSGKKFSNFGAIGIAWLFSNENFLKDDLILSFGKLKASYGTSGNDQLLDYEYLDAYTSSSGSYQGLIGLTPVRLSNPNFAWEENKKLEFGLELGFFKNRIFSKISYYKNRSSNQLVGRPLPPTTGFVSIQSNLPATVENTGIEIELESTLIDKSEFSWILNSNLTIPKNKLIEFPNLEASPSYSNQFVVGEPLNIVKLYHSTGVDPETGLYTFEDVNNDGNLNIDDQQTIKFVGREYYGGIQNILKYKGFELNFLLQFVKQSGYSYSRTISGMPGAMINQSTNILDRWTTPGDISDTQLFSQSSPASLSFSNLLVSDATIVNSSYLRMKNISISWSLPNSLMSKLNIQSADLFFRGQNLLTFTKYDNLDPETIGSFLPPLKVMSVGINLTL